MRTTSVSSGPDAAKQISGNRIELLVLDTLPIYLPGLPNLQALKGGRPHLHVILIPPLDEKPEPGRAHISGVDATLVRPLSTSKLLSVVDALG